jgi:hypothetical protein
MGSVSGLRRTVQRKARAVLNSYNGSQRAIAACWSAGYLLLLGGPASAAVWPVALGFTLAVLAEGLLEPVCPVLAKALHKRYCGAIPRSVLRCCLVLAWCGPHAPGLVAPVAALQVLLFAGLTVNGRLTSQIHARRNVGIWSRNIDIWSSDLPELPPRWLTYGLAPVAVLTEIPFGLGLFAAAPIPAGPIPPLPIIGLLLTAAGRLLWAGLLLGRLRAHRSRVPGRPECWAAVADWLTRYQPTTTVYFPGGANSAYQLNMWLDTLAEAPGRPLVLLRDRKLLPQLEPTALPVLCVPSSTDLMALPWDSLQVVLYPANVGNNIHMLRLPTAKHAFIGHGDSDKAASVNPYAKVYDQVWPAGPAGRDRWAAARVGVRDEDVVEVGRPQLRGVRPEGPADAPTTVLYAPTWESWTSEPGNTSLLEAGEPIIRQLLAAQPPVRILYKPHPYTGIRDPQARKADARIRALLGEAAPVTPAQLAAAQRLAVLDAEIDALTRRSREHTDDLGRNRDDHHSHTDVVRIKDLAAQRAAAYWAAAPPDAHRVVTGLWPHLYDCFNECDALVSDISSVVSDFLASGKPYALTNNHRIGDEEFRSRFTAARAAWLLGQRGQGVDAFLAAVRGTAGDPYAEDRGALRSYLLGSDGLPAGERFHEAVRSLAAESRARNAAAPTMAVQ